MDFKKILETAASRDDLSAVFSFKLDPELKEHFIAECARRNLSTGGVMRELLRQFMERCDA